MSDVFVPTTQVKITKEKVLLKCTNEKESLEFDFKNHKFIKSKEILDTESYTNFIGVIGTIQLLKGSYLIAIKQSKPIGEIKKTQIQMIKTINILPIGNEEKLTSEQVKIYFILF